MKRNRDKPLCLLDVDGVLCPFRYGYFTAFDGSGAHTTSLPVWKPTTGGYLFDHDAGVFYSPKNGDRIRKIQRLFAMYWCTGWGNRANDFISPLHDLAPYPVVPLGLPSRKGDLPHWKGAGITEHVHDRPFAFVDDDIGQEEIEWAEERTNKGIPTLMVPIRSEVGLTDYHIDRLLVFANGIESGL